MKLTPALARLLAGMLLLAAAIDAGAAVTYVARSTRSGSGTRISINSSGSVVAGDLMVAQISLTSNAGCSRISSVPSGWTPLGCQANGYTGGWQNAMAIYYKVATASDTGASFRWSLNTYTSYTSAIWVYRGVDITTPIDAGPAITTYSNSRNATSGSITTVTDGAMALNMVSANTSRSRLYTPPSGWTERDEVRSAGGQITLSDYTKTSHGTVGPVTTSLSNSQYGVVFLFALRPLTATQVAWYPFDGANWLADGSTYGYTATAHGTAAAGLGKVCTGFAGDGSGWITVAHNANQSFTSAYAITAWIYPTSYPGADLLTILAKDENYELHLTPSGHINWWYNSDNGVRSLNSSATVTLNAWTHVAVVFDRVARVQRLYINGALDSAWSYSDTPTTTTQPIYIGSDYGFTGAGQRNFIGSIDEVHIYSGAITQSQVVADMNATHTCGVDHYRIVTDGLGLTCQSEPITVVACSDSTCTSAYSGTASVNLSVTGTVSPGPTLSPTTVTFLGGTGSALLTYTKAGTATLSASGGSPVPGSVSPYRCFKAGTEVALSACTVAFSDSRFTLGLPALTACMDDDVTITSDACTSTVTGNQDVTMWFTYSDPASGTRAPRVQDRNGTWHTLTNASPYVTVPLTFDASGAASFAINYPDAGKFTLNTSATVSGATILGNGTTGSAPDYLVAYTDTVCPEGSEPTCPVAGTAGAGFALKVKAACYEATHSAPADAPFTPNFALANIPLSISRVVSPVGGVVPTLGTATFDFKTTDNGVASVTQTVSEVGVFKFTTTPPTYTDLKLTVDGLEGPNVGRFIPDHYAITPLAATNRGDLTTCASSPFTYMGEPVKVQFTMSARNAADAITKNYTGTLVKFDPTKMDGTVTGQAFNFTASTGNVTLSSLGAANAWGSGTGETGTLTAMVTIGRPTTAIAPYTGYYIYAAPLDPDQSALSMPGVAQAVNTNALEARYGRLRLDNAIGSSKINLGVPVYADYWVAAGTAGYWALNGDDSCTPVAKGRIGFGNYEGPVTSLTVSTDTMLSGGKGVIKVDKPNASGSASMALQLGTASANDNCPGLTVNGASPDLGYLQDAWCNGTQRDPASRLTFDIYRKGSNFIYLRENY